ncbi:DUF1189 family protein [Candidatus Proelusimicrobium volucris]|uniref:DUF1189 family protein n=1 Tax=Candidatus Proelusimicrobium volucris TaxID=3416225 RepID=UPI003D0C1757
MLLGPIKALYNMKFYLESLGKSAWRAFFFVVYISVITVVLTSLFSVIFMGPTISQTVDTMIDYLPEMEITNGKIKVNNNQPLTISPETLGGYNIVFDTGRTEPVYPTEMRTSGTLLLISADKVYFSLQDRFQESQIPADINANIDRETLNASKEPVANMAMGVILAFMLLAQIFRIPFMLLLAFVVVLVLGRTMRVPTKSGDNFKIACYIQAPALLIYLISYFTPIPGFLVGFAYLAVFVIYGQIIFNAKRLQDLPEEPEQSLPQNTENNEEQSSSD